MRLTAVIADDEPLARVWLRDALEAQDVEVLSEAATGLEGVRLCAEHTPDVFFTDIRMPDLNGIEAAAALSQYEPSPVVVFVSGYGEHAADAFEKAAFDYLLKPVTPERLATTLARLRRTLESAKTPRLASPERFTPMARIPVRVEYSMRLLRVEEIECAIAGDKRVTIWAKGEGLKTYYSLTELEKMLPAERFFRTHASAIVQIDRVEEINLLGNHTYNARLTSGLIVPVGRTQYPEIQRRLGIA